MINYQLLYLSQEYYKIHGFEIIEVPWFVPKWIDDITRPSDRMSIITHLGCLPASGEQSFLSIYNDLKDGGRYQCITPCYRDEIEDEWHLPYFMKNELIIKGGEYKDVLNIVRTCQNFFQIYSEKPVELKFTTDGIDLEIDGIEIGSYGFRTFGEMTWVYATGCAEPRFSKLINKNP